MKVKEIPISFLCKTRLRNTNTNKLIAGKKSIPVIVSLASIPSRLHIVDITIKSILHQSVLPEKIVLFLHSDLKNKLPKKLENLIGDIFTIRFTDYHSSHRKLVESLKLYPNNVILTCDDDMMYRKDWLYNIYEEHRNNPNSIIANQTRSITYDESGKLLPYKAWAMSTKSSQSENSILPIGAGGTLYPPNSLDERVFDQKLFLKLTPKADDLWFKAMSLLKGTKSRQASNTNKEPIPILGSQKESLKKTNIKEDKNREQWQALSDYFQLKF